MNQQANSTGLFLLSIKSFLKDVRDAPPLINVRFWCLFQAGLFFLPSSAFLSGLFLLPALFYTTPRQFKKFWNDPWNKAFFIIALLMLLGIFSSYTGWLAIVGLGNWLPFVWLFIAAQPFLLFPKARRQAAVCLVAGTFPVLLTGFGQLWFGWQGPWEIFNGLIVWFISPGGEPVGRLSGLFDYANIAGAWLAVVWPFSLALLLQVKISRLHRFFAFIFAILIVCALVLTDSRNAWGGLFLALPFVVGPTRWYWLLPLLAFISMLVAFASFPLVHPDLQTFARRFVPESIWSRLNDMQYSDSRILDSTRLRQWQVAVEFITERPWFGWGAAAFSVLYPLRTGQWHGHAHNLPLDLAVSHGLPVALIFVFTVVSLLITALKRGVLLKGVPNGGNFNEKIFDRAWWSAAFVLLAMHGVDMPFFDSRINIVGWILLAGLRSMLYPGKQENLIKSL